MKICITGDIHGNLKITKKIKNLKPELILITGDTAKADFTRKIIFENIRRKNSGLEEKEFTVKDEKTSYMEIFNSSIKIWKTLSKIAPTYSLMGNVGRSILKEKKVKESNKKLGLKLPSLNKEIKKIDNFYLIRDKTKKLNEIKIGFLDFFNDICWNKEYKEEDNLEKAKKETEKAKQTLKKFGKLDILICHQPPYGYLDKTNSPFAPKSWKGKHAGSKVILEYIKKQQPKYVFCGHIHEAKGKAKIGKSQIFNLGLEGIKMIKI